MVMSVLSDDKKNSARGRVSWRDPSRSREFVPHVEPKPIFDEFALLSAQEPGRSPKNETSPSAKEVAARMKGPRSNGNGSGNNSTFG